MLVVDFFFQAEDGIRDADVTGVQTCALPILRVMEIVGAESECVRVLAEEWLVSRQRRHGSALPRYGMGISGLRFEELPVAEIGRASCRERAESTSVGAGMRR